MSPSKEWAFSTEGKEGKFSNEGFEVMKIHSVIRAQIVERFLGLKKVAQIIRRHQEHMDGSGYPEGLRGDQIPFLSQVLTVCDVYSTLIGNRL
ncbi:HD domain-containing phosphohydrolase [Pseudothermotoga sp.]|uniref:HD-GYP domain-containing protein n=1 Tax=Pseudothermotoga sp. TaxID=2033661 RepID=UPI00258A8906|nr:HD domain-containing phosphohydrolase [Pseudothermotoga sp.]